MWEVSSLGRVRNTKLNKVLKPYEHNGYLCVGYNSKTQKRHKVHRLVCQAFHGDAPPWGTNVDHIDANRMNNRADNLRWIEFFENSRKDCMKNH